MESNPADRTVPRKPAASAGFAFTVRLLAGRHNLFLRLCVVHLCIWRMTNIAWLYRTDKEADRPTRSFGQAKVEEGRRREGAGESFHRSDLWSVWLCRPATWWRKEPRSAVSRRAATVSCLGRSKQVLNRALGVWNRGWTVGIRSTSCTTAGWSMAGDMRRSAELYWPLLLLRLFPPSHIFRLFLNMTVWDVSSLVQTDAFPTLLSRERERESQ